VCARLRLSLLVFLSILDAAFAQPAAGDHHARQSGVPDWLAIQVHELVIGA
jgi:hypothetical protein